MSTRFMAVSLPVSGSSGPKRPSGLGRAQPALDGHHPRRWWRRITGTSSSSRGTHPRLTRTAEPSSRSKRGDDVETGDAAIDLASDQHLGFGIEDAGGQGPCATEGCRAPRHRRQQTATSTGSASNLDSPIVFVRRRSSSRRSCHSPRLTKTTERATTTTSAMIHRGVSRSAPSRR